MEGYGFAYSGSDYHTGAGIMMTAEVKKFGRALDSIRQDNSCQI